MSPAVILPLLLCLAICLVPLALLRNRDAKSRQESLVSPGYIPPEAIRNASIAYSIRLVALWPAIMLGGDGNFLGAAFVALGLGLGIYLLYHLRGRIFPFLEQSLSRDESVTVHAFIAQSCGGEPRVRVVAASLTLFVLAAVIACEAVLLYIFFAFVFESDLVARALTFGALLLAALHAFSAGHPGVIYSGQLQLGAIFLGLISTAALLLYQHVSALTPLPSNGYFGIGLAAFLCLAIIVYRRSRYIETGAIDRNSRSARLLSKFGKLLNPVISVFAVLVIVLAGMDLVGGQTASQPVTDATRFPVAVWPALALMLVFYPLVDVVQWQRLAAVEVNREAYRGDHARWLNSLRGIFRIYAADITVLWLLAAALGTITVAALAPTGNPEIISFFVSEGMSGANPIVTVAFSLLLMTVAAVALSTMAASFSGGLYTLRYDILGSRFAGSSKLGRLFFLATFLALIAATELLPRGLTLVEFLAAVFALGLALVSPILAFVPLILGPVLTGRRVDPGFALAILAAGAVSTLVGLVAFFAIGEIAWLGSAAPLALGLGVLLYAAGAYGSRMR